MHATLSALSLFAVTITAFTARHTVRTNDDAVVTTAMLLTSVCICTITAFVFALTEYAH